MDEELYPCPTPPNPYPNIGDSNVKAFYIIWNPSSARPPTVRFHNLEDAQKVAAMMVAKHGETFFVCKAVSCSEKAAMPVKTTVLK